MAKIGRNEKCPCGSGKKYKRCCGLRQTGVSQPRPADSSPVTLTRHINEIQQAAVDKRQHLIEIGVFILFSTLAGDSWLLELTDSDCIQLADAGKIIKASINESPEVIEVDWSHTFAISNKQFEIVGYKDKKKKVLVDYPTMEIAAAIKRIKKRFSESQLGSVHIDPQTIE